MMDTYARTIFDDMDGSTFEHSVDCPKQLWISTRCDSHLPYRTYVPILLMRCFGFTNSYLAIFI